MSEARCDNCRFWLKSEKIPGTGECRRHTPRGLEDYMPMAYWPVTKQDDWCGEFEAKISPEEKAKLDALARKVKEDSQPKLTQNMP